MRKLFSLIAAVLFAGSMMYAAETTVSWTAKSGALGSGIGSGTISTGDFSWSYTRTLVSGASYTGWTSECIQLGKNGGVENLTLTTSEIPGTIKSVAVECASYQGKHNVAITVGGTSYLAKTATPKWTTVEAQSGTGTASGEISIVFTDGSRAMYIKSITVVYEAEPAAVAKPTISGEASFFDETEVSIACTTEDAKIYYTIDGTEPSATSNAYSDPFKLNATATVKAIAIKGEDKSAIVEKTFTKAPVYASIEALVDAGLATGSIMQVSFEDKEITDIYVTNQSKRRGIFLNVKVGDKDVEIYYGSDDVPADWVVGGTVSGTIKATWTYYNNTQWEIIPAVEGWKWTDLTYEAPSGVSIVVKSTSIEVPAAGKSATVDVEYVNIEDLSSAAVAFYEADGTTPATYAWLEASLDANKDLAYDVEANANSEARTAYLKVYVGEVYSALVTLTQAGYVPDYAALPFAFDGGKSDIASTVGLTQSGLGSDYSASPKLKFDGTGDCLILKINEDAGDLSFDIKGNTFSEGTFTVQTSADGETYTDLKAYTELGATASEKLTVAAGVRYIKWIYTEKVNGNVALGNIALTKSTTTAIDNAAVETKAIKRIENGKLVIIKNGVRYSATGARL